MKDYTITIYNGGIIYHYEDIHTTEEAVIDKAIRLFNVVYPTAFSIFVKTDNGYKVVYHDCRQRR